MITRQRKRALNIIRCYHNVRVLHLIRSEKIKIEHLRQELKSVDDPKFISYLQGRFQILEGLTKHQTIKIELEALLSAMSKAELDLDQYHNQLDGLISLLSTITTYKNDHPH
jgi:hypothetical protein